MCVCVCVCVCGGGRGGCPEGQTVPRVELGLRKTSLDVGRGDLLCMMCKTDGVLQCKHAGWSNTELQDSMAFLGHTRCLLMCVSSI